MDTGKEGVGVGADDGAEEHIRLGLGRIQWRRVAGGREEEASGGGVGTNTREVARATVGGEAEGPVG